MRSDREVEGQGIGWLMAVEAADVIMLMSDYRLVDIGRGMRRKCPNMELSPQRNGE